MMKTVVDAERAREEVEEAKKREKADKVNNHMDFLLKLVYFNILLLGGAALLMHKSGRDLPTLLVYSLHALYWSLMITLILLLLSHFRVMQRAYDVGKFIA